MGNKNSKKTITYKPNEPIETVGVKQEFKGQNAVAREILQTHMQGSVPTDTEIQISLALQQSNQTGPLKKLDYITILTRLNPDRNNALISQYKVQDLIDLIRYELYTKPIQEVIQTQNNSSTVMITNNP